MSAPRRPPSSAEKSGEEQLLDDLTVIQEHQERRAQQVAEKYRPVASLRMPPDPSNGSAWVPALVTGVKYGHPPRIEFNGTRTNRDDPNERPVRHGFIPGVASEQSIYQV